MNRSNQLMSRSETAVLLVDVQEKLFPFIADRERILAKIRLCLKAAKSLGLPILATEQYPKGLGKTVPELAEFAGHAIDKDTFSCCGEPVLLRRLGATKSAKVLVIGIEAHVCVMQTVLDLIANSQRVYVAADAIGSRDPEDKRWALDRMAGVGATITTVEAAVFEWTKTSKSPDFKAISALIKEFAPVKA